MPELDITSVKENIARFENVIMKQYYSEAGEQSFTTAQVIDEETGNVICEAGGGGGESDFTTVKLTITFAVDASFEAALLIAPVYNEGVITNYSIIEQSNTEVNVLIPENGTLVIVILPCTDDELYVIATTVLTGDATVDEISGDITITGNASLELGNPK